MKAVFEKSIANGRINAPISKSYAHRLMISAALSDMSVINGMQYSNDITETYNFLADMGANINKKDKSLILGGLNPYFLRENLNLYSYESASSLRFVIPLLSLTDNQIVINCSNSIMNRSMDVYSRLFKENSAEFRFDNNKLYLRGPLRPGKYKLSTAVSSQFISGLLFALPLLNGDSIIEIEGPINSLSYVNMTIDVLEKHNICVEFNDNSIRVKGNQKYLNYESFVESDYSNAAVLDAFNLVGGNVNVCGLNNQSIQGDKVYTDLFDLLKSGKPTIDLSNCIDLSPLLFAVSALFNGASFINTNRLMYKESNRIFSMKDELNKFGVVFNVYNNSVEIESGIKKPNQVLKSHNDHRVVMALSLLLSCTGGEISGVEAVNKSYPDFFKDINELGIHVELIGE